MSHMGRAVGTYIIVCPHQRLIRLESGRPTLVLVVATSFYFFIFKEDEYAFLYQRNTLIN